MANNDPGKTTQLLERLKRGDEAAKSEFFQLVEQRLRAIARVRLGSQQNHHTLGITGVVQEAFLKTKFDFSQIRDGDHFFRVFATMTRQVLIDYARAKKADSRGGNYRRVPLLDDVLADFEENYRIQVLDLHEALGKLEQIDGRAHAVVDRRIFGGYTRAEIAQELGVSLKTVENSWRDARAWLYQHLREKTEEPER